MVLQQAFSCGVRCTTVSCRGCCHAEDACPVPLNGSGSSWSARLLLRVTAWALRKVHDQCAVVIDVVFRPFQEACDDPVHGGCSVTPANAALDGKAVIAIR